MRGTNPVRAQELDDGSSLWVQEVFYTIQGEGPFTGKPAVFVRLAGCNLRCYFCDTEFESSTWHPQTPELVEKIKTTRPEHCRLIVITGGEPLRQNIVPLIEQLLQDDLSVQIESNGTLWLDLPKDDRLHIVISPKTAYLNADIVSRAATFKYVIEAGAIDMEDGLPNTSSQRAGVACRLARPPQHAEVYVMPMDMPDTHATISNTKACVNIAKKFGYRLTLQTHKLAGFE